MILLVVIGFGAFYFLYVEKQREAYSENLLRTLTTSGENIGLVLEGRGKNVDIACSVKNDDPKADLIEIIKAKLGLIETIMKNEWSFTQEFLVPKAISGHY